MDKSRSLAQGLLKSDDFVSIPKQAKLKSSTKLTDDKEFLSLQKIIFDIEGNDYCILYFKQNQHTLLLLPVSDISFIQLETMKQKAETLLSTSSVFATITFGKKFMHHLANFWVYDVDFELVGTVIRACIPYGRIIEDNFEDVELNLKEDDKTLKAISATIQLAEENMMPQSKKIIQSPLEEITFSIKESIICYQFDHPEIKDFYKIEGEVTCLTKGNANEEITLNLSNLSNSTRNSFKMVIDGKIEKKNTQQHQQHQNQVLRSKQHRFCALQLSNSRLH